MPNANDKPLGYAAAADAYWQAGWRGILPFRARSKWPPPKDTTGYTAPDPSYPDIMAWSEQYVDGNLGLRLPNNDAIAVVGIDVDDYDSKTGAATFAEAVRRWGPLPAAPRSTSREGNRISGIRLFRVPPGTQLETVIAFPELGIGDIEIIQHHHRYVICWPSIHPEGRPYWWRNDDDQFLGIPEPDGLPWLPRPWVDGLRVQPRVPGEAKADVAVTLTEGEPSMAVKLRLGTAISELNLPGTSRHDTCTRHVMALTRLGKSGEPGVKQALHVLCNVLIAARQVDKSDTPEGTRLEFERMLTNDNLARELATPGITDWVQDMVVDTGQDGGNDQGEGAEPSSDQPETVSSPGAPELDGAANANAPSDNEGRDNQPTRSRSRLEDIEQGFWDSRESLKMVYNTAMARMCPPWAVLAHTAGRALTMVRPHVTLPPLIGGRGSLNWFAAVVAPSGGGKGASGACAQLLVPAHIETRNVGSGEGIIAAFGRPADDDDPTPIHEALMFTADEVDTLAAMNQRSASTTLSILRSGFSGETIGFSYAAREKRRHIGAHTYRMAFVVSVQPTRAGWLIDDGGGGTPQRFMWFPGTDGRISKKRPWESGALTLPPPAEWQYPREIVIPEEAADLILDERVKAMQGDQSALDGHALYCREKFAYSLTVMDGRVEMTSEDWELSGIAADVSAYTREQMIETVLEASQMEAIDRGELRGVENAAADAAKLHESAERMRRILRRVLAIVEEAGEEGIAHRELQRRIAHRDRKFFDGAVEHARSSGLIRQMEGTTLWVKI
jgi:hypothetical protein